MPLLSAGNAQLKGWLVERDAAATRRRYLQLVTDRQLRVPVGADLCKAVRARVGARSKHLGWPKQPGGLHIFLAYSVSNWEVVLPKALGQFGEVTAFEWRARGFDEAAPDWLAKRELMNQQMLAAFDAAQRVRPVDIVVGYLSGHTASPELLQEMAARGAIILNFCFDDKVRWPGRICGGRYTSTAAIAQTVDINLTSDPEGIARYAAHGGLAMFHPEAADPECYRPLENVSFEYNVSFVGARYGWRPNLVRGLERYGIHVACFGRGWPNGPVSNEEMNSIYAKSRVNLGCGGVGYSATLQCLKGRDFEVPMSGSVYLTQANPELSLVYDVGTEILTYSTIEDCARQIRAALDDERRAARIREAARARCLREHTYLARWAKVFEMLGATRSWNS